MPKVVDHGERRRVIADAALRVVAAQGIADLTLQDVAKMAGCSTGMVNHYFSNKHALILATAKAASDRFSDGFFTRPRPGGDDAAQLVELLLATLPLTDDERPAHRVFVHLYSEGMNDPAIVAIARTYLECSVTNTAELLRQGQRVGWVRDDVDIDTASRVLVSAIDSMGIQILLSGVPADLEDLNARVGLLVRLVTDRTPSTPAAPAARRRPA